MPAFSTGEVPWEDYMAKGQKRKPKEKKKPKADKKIAAAAKSTAKA
jgi:hypothetical protein